MSNILIDLLNMLGSIIIFFFVVRFLLQAARADDSNPISQGIVTITDPVAKPIRALLPTSARWDFASLLSAFLLQALITFSIYSLGGKFFPGFAALTVLTVFEVLEQLLMVYWLFLIIHIIASWVAPGTGHPALNLLNQILEPILAPARNLIPPIGGFDFSILLVIIVVQILRSSVLPEVAGSALRALAGQ